MVKQMQMQMPTHLLPFSLAYEPPLLALLALLAPALLALLAPARSLPLCLLCLLPPAISRSAPARSFPIANEMPFNTSHSIDK
jgi:hypothetical protein